MKVLIAIDSFKGSLTSLEAGLSAKEGVKRVYRDAEVLVSPIADGGEGTVEALITALDGQLIKVKVLNPLGEEIVAEYGIVENTAIMEMSTCAGITLIEKERLNPMVATTYGVGQMIEDALNKGVRKFIIGIGGSATNDGGVGMLSALGFEFLDKNGEKISFGAKGLSNLAKIKIDNANPKLKESQFFVACDVKNPLCGESGCSRVFSRQKGAKEEDIDVMDKWLSNYADITKTVIESADKNAFGTGAAGGMGFALLNYLNATLQSGIELVLKEIKLEEKMDGVDLVITGEGKIDGQTAFGKAPIGVAKLAKKYGKTVFAFAGAVDDDARVNNDFGLDAIFSITPSACSLEKAMESENAKKNMANTVEQVLRAYKKARE